MRCASSCENLIRALLRRKVRPRASDRIGAMAAARRRRRRAALQGCGSCLYWGEHMPPRGQNRQVEG